MTSGILHVTAITRVDQRNVDFYMGFLGLWLVKKTGGFEDAEQLHLFHGNQRGCIHRGCGQEASASTRKE